MKQNCSKQTSMDTSRQGRCAGFDAVANRDSRVLILGTLPGEESLRRHEYYAKKENSFWKIMGALMGAFPERPYWVRLDCLRKSGIALWDVCASAHRLGSLDAMIQPATIVPNDFQNFFQTHQHIKLICFNGQPAEKLFKGKVLEDLPPTVGHLPRTILPSTSPAHAKMPFAEKLLRWRTALNAYIEVGEEMHQ